MENVQIELITLIGAKKPRRNISANMVYFPNYFFKTQKIFLRPNFCLSLIYSIKFYVYCVQ